MLTRKGGVIITAANESAWIATRITTIRNTAGRKIESMIIITIADTTFVVVMAIITTIITVTSITEWSNDAITMATDQ